MSKLLLATYLASLITIFVFIICLFVKDEQIIATLSIIITSYFITAYLRLNKINFIPLLLKPHLIISVIFLFMIPTKNK